ncbi:hypothetical protein HY085_02795 [Candidatus Gottesmanbacteria bacterium]|nr:hypothetical protein [Candidatus Gottesmanbacteria bacterium]
MKNLSKEELRAISSYLGNIGVAWFGAGIIAPFFLNKSVDDLLFSFLSGVLLSLVFLLLSILVLRLK